MYSLVPYFPEVMKCHDCNENLDTAKDKIEDRNVKADLRVNKKASAIRLACAIIVTSITNEDTALICPE